MSLRKSPTRTPASLAANRANAQKSTGPRTAGGKARARLNRLRHGRRSPLFTRFRTALRENPSRSRWVSQSLLTLEDTRHPLFAYYLRQWGQVWARTHAYQLTFKRKLKRIERLARLLRDVGLTAEVKKEIEFQARYGIWQQPRARGHQLSPILSQNRRKTSRKGVPPLWNTTGAGMLLKRMEMQKGPLYGLVGSNDVKYNQSFTLEKNLCDVLVTDDVYEKQDS